MPPAYTPVARAAATTRAPTLRRRYLARFLLTGEIYGRTFRSQRYFLGATASRPSGRILASVAVDESEPHPVTVVRFFRVGIFFEECNGLQRISLDAQGEAVAVAVAVVTGTVFSGAGTVFSGAGTGSSTTTVRAGGTGGAASSRLPALMRPRRNPTNSPKSSPTANVANHIRTALSSLTVIPTGLAPLLLLPIVLSLHPSRTHTCPAPYSSRSATPATPATSTTPR